MSIFNTNKTGPWSVNEVYDKIKTDQWAPYDPDAAGELYVWGAGPLAHGLNSPGNVTGPAQIPGDSWLEVFNTSSNFALKDNGTLWSWGYNQAGDLGDLTRINRSSPIQIPGTAWCMAGRSRALKSDSTLWVWGGGGGGVLGLNAVIARSSPTQIPGSWCDIRRTHALKANGTLWSWGYNTNVGDNASIPRSSPVQIPGTNWASIGGNYSKSALKTDGTLWRWGSNGQGQLGVGDTIARSSPIQIPGTWVLSGSSQAIKSDGTLWSWGSGTSGNTGDGNFVNRSSPVQVPGTSWIEVSQHPMGLKSDGTLWSWGSNALGRLGINSGDFDLCVANPVSISGKWTKIGKNTGTAMAIKGKC